MTNAENGLSLSTVGAMIDTCAKLYVYCDHGNCSHGRTANLEKLADRYGRSFECLHASLIKLPWRCDRCGGRKVTFRIQPGSKQYTFYKPDPDEPF